MAMKIYDGFETKAQAMKMAKQLRTDKKYPVQFVRIKKTAGRLKYLVMIGGKNSSYW